MKVKVVIPKKLTDRQRELLGEFAKADGEDINPEQKGFFKKMKDVLGGI